MKKNENNNIDENNNSAEENGRVIRMEKRKKKNGILKYIVLLILVIAIAYGMLSFFAKPSDEARQGKITGQMEIESTGKYDFAIFGKNIVSCNQNGIFAYNKSGNMQWKIEQTLSNPKLYSMEDMLLVTDFARNSALVVRKNGKLVNSVDFGTECINATVNKNGWITAILSAKGYKAQIAVYNDEGKLKYTWNSANNDIISAELCSDNKTLAVSQIDSTSSAEANGVISLFDISIEGKPFAGINAEENIVPYLRWNGKNLICVGNKAVFKLDGKGNEIWKYPYQGDMAVFNAESDSVLAFAVNNNNTSSFKSYNVYVLNNDGKELGKSEISGDLKNIEISGSNIAVITSDKIFILKKNAEIKDEFSLNRDVSKGLVLEGGKSYFVLSGTSAEILSLN